MVLNGGSTHPNPWKPPTPYESTHGFYATPRIYKGYPYDNTMGPPQPSRWADGTFGRRLLVSIKNGICVGLSHCVIDMLYVKPQPTTAAAVSRGLFLVTPPLAAFVSYTASRELFTKFLSEDKYDWKPTVAASITAGSVLGLGYKSHRVGFYGSLFIACFTALDIQLSRMGYIAFVSPKTTDEVKRDTPTNRFIWKEGDPFYRVLYNKPASWFYPEEEVPNWKKFEEKSGKNE